MADEVLNGHRRGADQALLSKSDVVIACHGVWRPKSASAAGRSQFGLENHCELNGLIKERFMAPFVFENV